MGHTAAAHLAEELAAVVKEHIAAEVLGEVNELLLGGLPYHCDDL